VGAPVGLTACLRCRVPDLIGGHCPQLPAASAPTWRLFFFAFQRDAGDHPRDQSPGAVSPQSERDQPKTTFTHEKSPSDCLRQSLGRKSVLTQ